jgi:uncharacterized repeat protein (TIGR01451 family)
MKTKTACIVLAISLSLTLLGFLLVQADPSPVRADASASTMTFSGSMSLSSLDPTSPTLPVRLIFIHHSTGENWLADDNGELGMALRDNNYFVSDTNYCWGPGDTDVNDMDPWACSGQVPVPIGSHTDIPNWYSWFTGPHRDTYLASLYAESDQHSSYSRLDTNPGGQNTIIMFKSCFPNSDLDGDPNDPPADHADHTSDLTVANAKRIYLDLLTYFAARQDKLFVVITAPPRALNDGYNSTYGANARALNNWLTDEVNGWLKDYAYKNVAVFDFYNVLTSNGGDSDTNDLGQPTGNHHRYRNGTIEHVINTPSNTSAYPTGDSHPSQAGNLKATGEFVPLLNIFYHRWQAGSVQMTASAGTPRYGQAVTYTILVRGLTAPLTTTIYLTDVVPSALSYVPDTLTATTGLITATLLPTLTWSGVLSPTPVVTVTFAVTVNTLITQVVANTAIIAAPGYPTITRTATIIANGYAVYLPLVMRNSP